jgi:hypothetical protein
MTPSGGRLASISCDASSASASSRRARFPEFVRRRHHRQHDPEGAMGGGARKRPQLRLEQLRSPRRQA